jgi:hypothetical protein
VKVLEIAQAPSRSEKPVVEVWNEALTLHRVRYETEVLGDEDASPQP